MDRHRPGLDCCQSKQVGAGLNLYVPVGAGAMERSQETLEVSKRKFTLINLILSLRYKPVKDVFDTTFCSHHGNLFEFKTLQLLMNFVVVVFTNSSFNIL